MGVRGEVQVKAGLRYKTVTPDCLAVVLLTRTARHETNGETFLILKKMFDALAQGMLASGPADAALAATGMGVYGAYKHLKKKRTWLAAFAYKAGRTGLCFFILKKCQLYLEVAVKHHQLQRNNVDEV